MIIFYILITIIIYIITTVNIKYIHVKVMIINICIFIFYIKMIIILGIQKVAKFKDQVKNIIKVCVSVIRYFIKIINF